MMNLAYQEGKARAEADFGTRLAFDAYQKGIPHGDMGVSAERLAKTLATMSTGLEVPKDEKKHRFGNPVRWGGVTTPHGTGASSYDYSNVGPDQGAI